MRNGFPIDRIPHHLEETLHAGILRNKEDIPFLGLRPDQQCFELPSQMILTPR